MNTISEFELHLFASDLSSEVTTWRWLPHDPRSQPLYADGALPPELAAEFETLVAKAQLFILETDAGNEVHYLPVEGVRPATDTEAIEILDGFLWVARHGNVRPAIDPSNDGYWQGHLHPIRDDVEIVDYDTFLTTIAGAVEYVRLINEQAAAAFAKQQIKDWDARAKRWKKLGWSDADVVAEFGPRPSLDRK